MTQFLQKTIAHDPPIELSECRIVGTLVEIGTTRDQFEELAIGYLMMPVPPPGWHGWRILDSSKDHHTTWIRDVHFIVEARS
jgi:hypothetical protein